MGRALVALAWLALLPLGVLTLARVTRLDDRIALVFAIETATLYLYLPLYPIAAVAGVFRQRVLFLASAVLILCHAVFVWSDAPVWRDSRSPGGTPMTVVALNVHANNPTPAELGRALSRLRSDVLVLVELSPGVLRGLEQADALDRFPHRFEDERPGFYGSAIYSRFPMTSSRVRTMVGFPTSETVLTVGDTNVRLVAIHTRQPLAGLDALRAQLTQLRKEADSTSLPVIFAGDFNATRHHRPFRQLLDGNLRDAHLATGRGLARSWAVDRRVPTFALLDHVLVSKQFEVDRTEEATMPGSDHRAIRVSLRLKCRTPVRCVHGGG